MTHLIQVYLQMMFGQLPLKGTEQSGWLSLVDGGQVKRLQRLLMGAKLLPPVSIIGRIQNSELLILTPEQSLKNTLSQTMVQKLNGLLRVNGSHLGFMDLSLLDIYSITKKNFHTFQPDGLINCWYPSWSEDATLLAFEARTSAEGVWNSIWAIEFPQE